MSPDAVLNPVEKAGQLSAQYGFQVVVCFVVIIFLGAVIWFVLMFMRDLIKNELARNTAAMQSLTEANNAAHANHALMFERISKDMKDGFDAVHRGNQYQREEHKEIIEIQRELKDFMLEKVTVICKVK